MQSAGFFNWWYIVSPKNLFKFAIITVKYNYHLFSISYLFRTLFAPWKRDILVSVNPSFADQIRVFAENLVSRFFGFVIRTCTIIAGMIICAITMVFLVLFILLWFAMPIIILACFYYGIKYLS